jgi:hypothetical protein
MKCIKYFLAIIIIGIFNFNNSYSQKKCDNKMQLNP